MVTLGEWLDDNRESKNRRRERRKRQKEREKGQDKGGKSAIRLELKSSIYGIRIILESESNRCSTVH